MGAERHLNDMSCEDVAEYMREAGHAEVAEQMLNDEIDGEALGLLAVSDFTAYGIKFGPAMKLANKLKQMGAKPMQSTESIAADPEQAFADKWGLDNQAREALGQLDAATRERVSKDFAPPTHCKSVSAVFMGFLKSVKRGSGVFATPPAAADMLGRVQEFIDKWGLDEKASDGLNHLDPAIQERVMSDFSPPADAKSVSAVFMGWMRSVASHSHVSRSGSDSEVSQFISRWGLDSKCQGTLMQLDAWTQQGVMRDFALPEDSQNPCAVFMGFVRSRDKSGGDRGRDSYRDGRGSGKGGNGHWGRAASGGSRAIDSFVRRWSLDNQALEVLVALDRDTQERVMSDFAPPSLDRANRIFMGFVSSVTNKGKGKSKGGRSSPY